MKNTPEIEGLMRQINGKTAIHVHNGFEFPVIFLSPPGGSQVSVKPYVEDDRRVIAFLCMAYKYPIEIAKQRAKSPTFCFAAHYVIPDDDDDQLEKLKRLAAIPTGGKYVFKEIVGNDDGGFDPFCPY